MIRNLRASVSSAKAKWVRTENSNLGHALFIAHALQYVFPYKAALQTICAQTLAPTIPLLCLAFIYELFKSLMQSQQRKNLLNFAGFPFCSICMKSYAHGKQKETCHKTWEMLKTAKRTTTSTSNRDYSAASA